MPVCELKSWDEFPHKISELRSSFENNVSEIWFRGHSNSDWNLSTTLERRTRTKSIYEYYRIIFSISSRIEAFADRVFLKPNFSEVLGFCTEYDSLRLKLSVADLPALEYIVYLRHHGFPSPLLDWTRSPYVAAYFAFREISESETASIYVFAERPDNMKMRSSDRPSIYAIGPNISAHRRHFFQRSAYTVCVQFDQEKQWQFISHDSVFDRDLHPSEPRQDVLWKITIPTVEREKVLKSLDEYNLSAFSLFGSEESLMETLAIQAFDLD